MYSSPTMRGVKCGLTLAVFSALLLAAVLSAHAQTETVLYSFAGSPDGSSPYFTTPVLNAKGNLYGTTMFGGTDNDGTVFELTPSGTETVLHSFDLNGTDGVNPEAGLVLDKKGNLYGTTYEGGAYGGTYGLGTVFEVAPSGSETILWNFGNGTDGRYPVAAPVLDKKGNIYGTTEYGGAYGGGTVFELTPSGTETILWSFGNGTDGLNPYAGPLILDKKGNLYGTTVYGGAYGKGTVFEVTPAGSETILWSFGNGTDGQNPVAGLVLDTKGNLYGTTFSGGAYGWGTVFKLTPSGTETILHSFDLSAGDGYYVRAGLAMDKKGNLYGTAEAGGAYSGGIVFEVTQSGTETILHSFSKSNGDGYFPFGGVVLDKKGNLYGMTSYGGTYGLGTAYKVTP